MSKAMDIAEGFTNLLKSKLLIGKKEIEELSEKRMTVCKECTYRNKYANNCGKCGCFLPAKTRRPKEQCPIDKWKKVN